LLNKNNKKQNTDLFVNRSRRQNSHPMRLDYDCLYSRLSQTNSFTNRPSHTVFSRLRAKRFTDRQWLLLPAGSMHLSLLRLVYEVPTILEMYTKNNDYRYIFDVIWVQDFRLFCLDFALVYYNLLGVSIIMPTVITSPISIYYAAV